MKQSHFDKIILLTSAPLSALGAHWYLLGKYGLSMMAIGMSAKIITAYLRTPENLFEEGENISIDEFSEKLEKYVVDLNERFPIISWVSRLGSMLFMGGLIVVLVEILQKF